MRAALAAAACTALAGIPALARAQQGTGGFTAHDVGSTSGSWDADGTGGSTVTVATGGTVTFGYPSGMSLHNVVFTDAQPDACSGLPPADDPQGPGWSGTCTFDHAGTYAFKCQLHRDMTGKVVVADAAAATPTPPGATPTPAPAPSATPAPGPQSSLEVTVRARQAGTHVRGSVLVQNARTRLGVTAYAPLSRGRAARVGGWLRRSAPAGRVAFSVPLDARARRALRRGRRLAVTLKVALTPPGGRTLHHTARISLRRG